MWMAFFLGWPTFLMGLELRVPWEDSHLSVKVRTILRKSGELVTLFTFCVTCLESKDSVTYLNNFMCCMLALCSWRWRRRRRRGGEGKREGKNFPAYESPKVLYNLVSPLYLFLNVLLSLWFNKQPSIFLRHPWSCLHQISFDNSFDFCLPKILSEIQKKIKENLLDIFYI